MIGSWGTWIVVTAVEGSAVALLLLALASRLRLGPRWAGAVLLFALLQFVFPAIIPFPGVGETVLAGLSERLSSASEGGALNGAVGRGGLSLLVMAQGAGGLLALVLLLRSIGAAGSLRRTGERVRTGPLAAALAMAADRLGVPAPALYLTEGIGPIATSVLRPSILLPRDLAEGLAPDRLRMVLAHELAHLRHRDALAGVVRALVLGLWWFHPVVWLIVRRYKQLAEEACDQAVVQHGFGSAADYCRTLLACARAQQRPPLFAAALGLHPLGDRISRLLDDDSRPNAGPMISATVLAGAVLLLPLGFGAAADAEGAEAQDVREVRAVREDVRREVIVRKVVR